MQNSARRMSMYTGIPEREHFSYKGKDYYIHGRDCAMQVSKEYGELYITTSTDVSPH